MEAGMRGRVLSFPWQYLRTGRRFALLPLMTIGCLCAEPILAGTLDILRSQTQEMADAVAPGNKVVWAKYLDARALYVSEDNEVKTKETVLAEIQPLPAGYSGTIKVVDFQVREHPALAVTTYIMDETEDVEGHILHNKYRETDVWRKTRAGWRLIAGQVLAIPKDPPEIQLSKTQLDEYAGVYRLSNATSVTIRVADGGLVADRPDGKPRILRTEVRDVFFSPGRPRERRIFIRDAAGIVSGFVTRREGEDLSWRRQ
jgi:ketosteroid isomerase-like protein